MLLLFQFDCVFPCNLRPAPISQSAAACMPPLARLGRRSQQTHEHGFQTSSRRIRHHRWRIRRGCLRFPLAARNGTRRALVRAVALRALTADAGRCSTTGHTLLLSLSFVPLANPSGSIPGKQTNSERNVSEAAVERARCPAGGAASETRGGAEPQGEWPPGEIAFSD